MLKVECKIEKDGKNIPMNDIVNIAKVNKIRVPFHYSTMRNGIWKFNVGQNLPVDESFLNEIDSSHNVYFIFDNSGKVLYVGKAKKIRNRLRQHFVNCPSKTSSKIENVADYILENKDIEIFYATIQIDPPQYYGTVEGMLIGFLIENNGGSKEYPWNIRED